MEIRAGPVYSGCAEQIGCSVSSAIAPRVPLTERSFRRTVPTMAADCKHSYWGIRSPELGQDPRS